ncbi:hypothetical protein V6N13_110640 [Hibiscus sabdariffa]|uniref:PB1-like domain-containing protein n=1 Tax=Hibiscus sabdariffa TaxID=183260 RepID=A0ABR2THU7_9ROSI
MKYTSQSEAYFDFVDASRFSTFSLRDMVQNLDLIVPFVVYWWVPEVALSTTSIRPLKTDHDYMTMLNNMPSNSIVVEEEYVAEEENIVVEEEESAAEEEEDYAVEEEEFVVEEFDVSDNEYDCGRDEGCKQDDEIGIRVQRNMDGFGPNGVHVNDKDHG